MKHTEMAGILGAALLVATCSAHLSAKTLIPAIDLSPGDALLQMRAPSALVGTARERLQEPMKIAQRAF